MNFVFSDDFKIVLIIVCLILFLLLYMLFGTLVYYFKFNGGYYRKKRFEVENKLIVVRFGKKSHNKSSSY